MSLQFLEPACTLALQLFAVKTRRENSSWVASLCTKTPCYKLTITRDEPSVVCAFLLECAAVWGGFAGGPLHEEVVFVKGAFPSSGIQWLAFLLERAPGFFPERLTFVGQESGAVFGVTRLECPERVRLVISTLRCRWAIIWIHGCHFAVWNARLGVHY